MTLSKAQFDQFVENYDIKIFHRYVYTFYGNGGVYPMGATYPHIREATQKYMNVCEYFCGDSIDRESVRDIMMRDYNLVDLVPLEQLSTKSPKAP